MTATCSLLRTALAAGCRRLHWRALSRDFDVVLQRMLAAGPPYVCVDRSALEQLRERYLHQ